MTTMEGRRRRVLRIVRGIRVTTVLDVLALALVVAGVAFMHWPAALVVAGVGVGVVSWQQGAPTRGDQE